MNGPALNRFAKARLRDRIAAIKSGKLMPPVYTGLLGSSIGSRITGTLSLRYA